MNDTTRMVDDMTVQAWITTLDLHDVARDDDMLARAALTWCIQDADSLMTALLKGCANACEALQLIARCDGTPGQEQTIADGRFVTGCAKWGRRANARGMQSFHQAWHRWHVRFEVLATLSIAAFRRQVTKDGAWWLVVPGDPCWPEQLADLALRSDWAPPLCLWGVGQEDALGSCPAPLAVVGSRGVNDYGRFVAQHVAAEAALQGHLVVSGGAMGSDAAAHWAALRAMDEIGEDRAGRTVAVFAGGLDLMGPAVNRHLFDEIIAHHGACVTELYPGSIPEARRFLMRNRIIAALASSLVVVQAKLRSGALNTAHWANELNRPCFAAPGNINMPDNAGCNALIHDQEAILLADATDGQALCHDPHDPVLLSTRPAPASSSAPTVPAACAVSVAPTEDTQSHMSGIAQEHEAMLNAIRACIRQHGQATVPLLRSLLQTTREADAPPDRQMLATLGTMELLGLIRTVQASIIPC